MDTWRNKCLSENTRNRESEKNIQNQKNIPSKHASIRVAARDSSHFYRTGGGRVKWVVTKLSTGGGGGGGGSSRFFVVRRGGDGGGGGGRRRRGRGGVVAAALVLCRDVRRRRPSLLTRISADDRRGTCAIVPLRRVRVRPGVRARHFGLCFVFVF